VFFPKYTNQRLNTLVTRNLSGLIMDYLRGDYHIFGRLQGVENEREFSLKKLVSFCQDVIRCQRLEINKK
jgi:hypothetical protein